MLLGCAGRRNIAKGILWQQICSIGSFTYVMLLMIRENAHKRPSYSPVQFVFSNSVLVYC